MSRKRKPNPSDSPPVIPPTEESPESNFVVSYKVIKPFKYQGKQLRAGDSFIPGGGLFDDKIISGIGRFVQRIESAMPNRKR